MTLAALKQDWQDFRQSRPGERFQGYYGRRHESGKGPLGILRLGLGLVLMLVGLVLMPAPGPGMVVVALGAVMVARESLWAARSFDAMELRLRALLRRLRR